jgi:hypothetical protein
VLPVTFPGQEPIRCDSQEASLMFIERYVIPIIIHPTFWYRKRGPKNFNASRVLPPLARFFGSLSSRENQVGHLNARGPGMTVTICGIVLRESRTI